MSLPRSAPLALPLALAVALVADPTRAQEKIILRLADSLPNGHVIHELVGKPFIERVTKATNGAVTFQHFPSEQLGKAKDMLALTQNGVADVAYIVPSYASDKMPLTAVAELPGVFGSQCQGSLAYYRLSHGGGILESREYAPNNLRALVTIALPAYQLLLSNQRAIRDAKDLEGLKMRTAGGAMDLTIRAIKGVPVRMAAPEIYESMTRGTLDGVLLSFQSSVSYDLGKLLKSGTVGMNFGTALITYSMGETRWRSLPESVRQALTEAGEETTRDSCRRMEEGEAAATEKIKAAGMKPIEFDEADRKAFERLFGAVANDWAKDLERRGKPGDEVLKAFKDAVAATQ